MAGERTLTVKILGDATSAQRALGSLDNATGQTESRFARFGAAMKVAMVGAGIAAIKFGKDSVDAFNESRRVSAQTEAVLKSTGGAAGVTADHVGTLASKLQRLSGVEDEAIQTGQNMLLTFTGIRNEAGKGNDVFDQATRTMLDMSVAMGTDAKSSAMQLGKALNDPVGGIGALTRVGVTFTAEQKNLIRSLVETGDKAGAQRVILAELNKEFGGSAKAAGDAQSPMQKLQLRFGELQEKVGVKLIPALEKLTTVGIGVIDFVSKLDPRVLALIATVGGLVVAVVAIHKAIQAWTAIQQAFNVVLAANPIGLVVLAVAALAAGIVIAYKNSETFRDIVQGAFSAVGTAAGAMKDVVVGAIRFLVDTWLAQVEWIVKAGAKAFGWLPRVGDDIRRAAGEVERFRDDVNRSLGGIRDKTVNLRLVETTERAPGGGRVQIRHSGGLIDRLGPREVPAILERGEYVVRASAVEKVGIPALEHINRLHDGGIVGVTPPTGGGGDARSVVVHQRVEVDINLPNFLGDKREVAQALRGELVPILTAELRRDAQRNGTQWY